MFLFSLKILIGALVGMLVGLTGLGGAVLLLPILIFGLGISPIIAVGSDAAFSALTKIGVGVFHWRRGTVDRQMVLWLCSGSIPGACLGVLLLAWLRSAYGAGVNDILRTLIGILLVGIPTLLLLQGRHEGSFARRGQSTESSSIRVFAIGLFAGILVGVSSVGSGSVIMVLLLLFTPCPPATLVGTDIVHAIALTGLVSLLQVRLGTVDPALVLPLLLGSVPGSLLGARVSARLPGLWLKRALCIILLATGAKMLSAV